MKMRFTNKSLLSLVLSFAMIISLLSGVVVVKETSQAAGPENRTINMGKRESGKGYYYYPDAAINKQNKNERYRYLTVLVDSGYLTTTKTQIKVNNETSVTGNGIVYGSSLNVGYKPLEVDGRYEAINFDLGEGTLDTNVNEYIQSIHFTTEATRSQKVTITVTTNSDFEMIASTKKSNGDNVPFEVHYFNGHFYGFIDSKVTGTSYSWNDAYKLAQESTFYGVKGYLATLTTRAEDRFIYANYGGYNEGWIGATRAGQSSGGYYDIKNPTKPEITWGSDAASIAKTTAAVQKYLKECQEKMVWKWVTGPEAGTVFGYQNLAYNDGVPGHTDGGFVTYDGMFSNWNKEGNIEPNGGMKGGNENEAYGYYGAYTYGRWNDHPDDHYRGFYIEFGLSDEDAKTLEENIDDHYVYTQTEDSEELYPDEAEYGKVFDPGPFIVNENADGSTAVGTKLTADISEIEFVKYPKDGHTISYQWFVEDDDGNLVPISEATVKNGQVVIDYATGKDYKLTDNTFGKRLVVRVTEKDSKGKTVGVGTSKPYQTGDGIYTINGVVTIKEDSVTEDGELVVKADISKVRPSGSHDDLEYEWYVVDDEGNPKEKLSGPNEDDTFTIPKDKDLEGEDIIVVVKPKKGSKYEGEISSGSYHIKEAIDGKPEIKPNGDNVVGTKLTADISGIGPAEANFNEKDFNYQWYIKNEDGTLTEIPGATGSSYTLTKNTVDKDIVVSATVKSTNPNYAGKVYSDPYDDRVDAKEKIKGKPSIDQVGDTLTAVVDGIEPEEVRDDLEYTWFVDGEEKGKGSTFDASEYPEGSDIYVEVSVPEDNPRYEGSAKSEHKKLEKDKTEVGDGQEKIHGKIVIENQTTDKDGNKVNRVGSLLFANIDQVEPNPDCHDSLSYQWYTVETDSNGNLKKTPIPGAKGKYYTLTQDTLDKTLVVEATADGKKYVGEVTSAPYNAARTNADIGVGDTVDENGKKRKIIRVTPAQDDMKYTVQHTDGTDVDDMDVYVVHEDGTRERLEDEDGDGYYTVKKGETIEFEVDPDGDYVIREKEIASSVDGVITPDIPDTDIKVEKDKNGKLTITIDPADKSKKYAVLKKDGDGYVAVTVTKKDGKYFYDEKGNAVWSDSGEGVVTFTELPGDGTYKIVAIGTNLDDKFGEIKPEDIANNGKGGSGDIDGSKVSSDSFTDAEKKKADEMLNGSFTNPKDGSIITDVDDCTRDKIIESEKEWKKLTEREKAAVDAKLKELGSKYTYAELLKMAKKWKIPYFEMKKLMKKGTKYKPKMIKCKGATIIASSNKKKVATVSKKGVIKAKKKGKAKVTITVVKGNYSNRLVINVVVKPKFKNAKEIKKVKNSGKIKTPTLLLDKKREVTKSTKINIKDMAGNAKVKYKSLNNKVIKVTQKGKKAKYTAKKKGSTLIKATVTQNKKDYVLYLYVTGFKNGKKAKK